MRRYHSLFLIVFSFLLFGVLCFSYLQGGNEGGFTTTGSATTTITTIITTAVTGTKRDSSITRIFFKRYPFIALAQCPHLPTGTIKQLVRSYKNVYVPERKPATLPLPHPPELVMIKRSSAQEVVVDEVTHPPLRPPTLCDYNQWNYTPSDGDPHCPAVLTRSPYEFGIRKGLMPHFTVVVGVLAVDNVVHGNGQPDRITDGVTTGALQRAEQRNAWVSHHAVWDADSLTRYMRGEDKSAFIEKRMLVRFMISRHPHVSVKRSNDTNILPYDFSIPLLAEAERHRDLIFLELNEGVGDKSMKVHAWDWPVRVAMTHKSLYTFALMYRMYSFDYMMKTDEDVVLRVPYYIATLDRLVTPRIAPYGTTNLSYGMNTEQPKYRGVYMGSFWHLGAWAAGMGITMSRNVVAIVYSDTEVYDLSGLIMCRGYSKNMTNMFQERGMYHEDVMYGKILNHSASRRAAPEWWWKHTPPPKDEPSPPDSFVQQKYSLPNSIKAKLAPLHAMGIMLVYDHRYIELAYRPPRMRQPSLLHHVMLGEYSLLTAGNTKVSEAAPENDLQFNEKKWFVLMPKIAPVNEEFIAIRLPSKPWEKKRY